MTVTVPRPQRPMVMHRMVVKNQPLMRTSFFATMAKVISFNLMSLVAVGDLSACIAANANRNYF